MVVAAGFVGLDSTMTLSETVGSYGFEASLALEVAVWVVTSVVAAVVGSVLMARAVAARDEREHEFVDSMARTPGVRYVFSTPGPVGGIRVLTYVDKERFLA